MGGLAEQVAAEGFSLLRYPLADAGYAEALASAVYLVAGLAAVTAQTLTAVPRLWAVLKHGVGLDSIDIAAASRAGVAVTSAPGANALAVAEMAVGAVVACPGIRSLAMPP